MIDIPTYMMLLYIPISTYTVCSNRLVSELEGSSSEIVFEVRKSVYTGIVMYRYINNILATELYLKN